MIYTMDMFMGKKMESTREKKKSINWITIEDLPTTNIHCGGGNLFKLSNHFIIIIQKKRRNGTTITAAAADDEQTNSKKKVMITIRKKKNLRFS